MSICICPTLRDLDAKLLSPTQRLLNTPLFHHFAIRDTNEVRRFSSMVSSSLSNAKLFLYPTIYIQEGDHPSFFYMGMLASKQTGQVRTGMQAGLVAGLTVGIISSFLLGLSLASLFILAIALGGDAMCGEMGSLIGYRWRKPLDDTTEADEESAINSSSRISL
jgi:hypothetical protein